MPRLPCLKSFTSHRLACAPVCCNCQWKESSVIVTTLPALPPDPSAPLQLRPLSPPLAAFFPLLVQQLGPLEGQLLPLNPPSRLTLGRLGPACISAQAQIYLPAQPHPALTRTPLLPLLTRGSLPALPM